MGTAQRLENDLQQSLIELGQRVQILRDNNAPANEIEQSIDHVETAWDERLLIERQAGLRWADSALRQDSAEREAASRTADNQLEANAYQPFDIGTRQKLWDAASRSTEPRSLFERSDEDKRRALFDAAAQVIERHADTLQDGLREATDAIRNGKQPSLQFILEAQIARENLFTQDQERRAVDTGARPLPWETQTGPTVAEPKPERKIKRSF